MLYSQGVPLEALGITTSEGSSMETDPRKIWQTFADHFHLFRGTPTRVWLTLELERVFGIHEELNRSSAHRLYDQIAACLTQPEYQPRQLLERFNIQVLCTTDPAWDRLEIHQKIRETDWSGRLLPTFRPDGVVNLDTANWHDHLNRLSGASGIAIGSYASFIKALEVQRGLFKESGAVATDHEALIPAAQWLDPSDAEKIFQRALASQLQADDAPRFTAHMLMEMARMSIEDGLVMQLHPAVVRNHNRWLYRQFGPDIGSDMPAAVEFTRNLLPLLNRFGNDSRLRLILFTLDESTYTRELAPLAGHYPSVRLGPPWWFNDSPNGIRRYLDQVIETAGFYNTAGFNDDTRAFLSIPARHEVWRRSCANWLAGQVLRGILTEEDAADLIEQLAVKLAINAYRLEGIEA
jgi:glucuronate isomerase